MTYDYLIIGGGIVGLSTALALSQKFPQARLLVVEKEDHWAAHQTGHNSGVIHSGIYYKPGSFKAQFARAGCRSMVAFCQEQGLPYEVCGKVIVATEPEELPRLESLYERGQQNGLEVHKIGPEELREREPHCAGLAALLVPSTGITDYRQVTERYAALLTAQGAELKTKARVQVLRTTTDRVTVETTAGSFETRFLINCAGLHSDRVTALAGVRPEAKIVPFRGEYYTLHPERRSLVKHLIYPVPDPQFPFLGVHFTRMIDGEVHAGPNAVLSLKREGYHKTDFSLADCADALTFGGFWRLAARNWREGTQEVVRSFSKAAFVRSLQRLIPEIGPEDVVPAHAGVRAQAMLPDGKLVDDFLIVSGPRSLHVCNAPSPGATASLEIGRYVANRIAEQVPAP